MSRPPKAPEHVHWILDDERNPQPVYDIETWVKWLSAARSKRRTDGEDFDPCRVGSTETATMWVSTVFLGADHNFWGKGPPILFESMVFSREHFPREFEGKISLSRDDFDTVRYSTWSDAEAGHQAIVRRIQKAEADAIAGIKSKGKAKQ